MATYLQVAVKRRLNRIPRLKRLWQMRLELSVVMLVILYAWLQNFNSIASRPPQALVYPYTPTCEEARLSTHEISRPPELPSIEERNECAPSTKFTANSAQEYISRFYATAQREERLYGIPASISLAQGLIESRAGTSKLAVNNNNHFGVKCFSRTCKKGHCTNATDDTHKDFFVVYGTAWESWRAHSKLLSQGRYRKLHKYKTYRQWAYGLQSCGYATARNYGDKLVGLIQRYGLHKYDVKR